MKPYKGIIRITCMGKTCKDKLREPIAGCVNCDQAAVEVIDLDHKTIAKKDVNRQTGKPANKKSSKE